MRKYRPDPVPETEIKKILDAANQAPSAMNRQQWEFIVVTKTETIRELGISFGAVIEELTRNLPASSGHGSLSREEFIRFAETYGGAPVAIVVLTDRVDTEDFRRANLESASAAMENLLLAATALGLGTCWMTGPLQDGKALRRILSIPDTKELVAVTPLGYPAEVPPAPARIDPDLVQKVRWVR
ncbi:nitroreductase family protein [Methanoregula sp. UBA64]|uniref:nitroreductase family protein n=1 Tax=Methanoregula sp. UBA64 TaxID=1915554 RepID=UPI0025E945FA|nr:nitroreductase family protein [Methanoregula sp. UBA64]